MVGQLHKGISFYSFHLLLRTKGHEDLYGKNSTPERLTGKIGFDLCIYTFLILRR